jgi:hypothetical protein
MILAEFDTRKFTLTTLAADEKSAYAQLRRAWKRHVEMGKRWGVDEDANHLERYKDDINYTEVEVGDVLMDGQMYLQRRRRKG